MSRVGNRVGTKTKAIPGSGSGKKVCKYKYPPHTKHHRATRKKV